MIPVSLLTALIGEALSLGDLLTTCDDVGKRHLAWWSHVPLEEWQDTLRGASSGAKLMITADMGVRLLFLLVFTRTTLVTVVWGSGLLSHVIAWNRKQCKWGTHSQCVS